MTITVNNKGLTEIMSGEGSAWSIDEIEYHTGTDIENAELMIIAKPRDQFIGKGGVKAFAKSVLPTSKVEVITWQ